MLTLRVRERSRDLTDTSFSWTFAQDNNNPSAHTSYTQIGRNLREFDIRKITDYCDSLPYKARSKDQAKLGYKFVSHTKDIRRTINGISGNVYGPGCSSFYSYPPGYVKYTEGAFLTNSVLNCPENIFAHKTKDSLHSLLLYREEMDYSSSDWRDAAFTVTPTIEKFIPGTNIIEFITSFKSTLTLLPDIIALARSLPGNFSIAKLSSGHLQYNFGLMPLLSDIDVLVNMGKRIEAFIADWNLMAQQRQILNYHADLGRKEFVEKNDIPISSRTSSFTIGKCTWRYSGVKTGVLSFYIRPLPIRASFWSIVKRLLGLDNIVSSAWASVPFSWLIDYFVDIESKLRYIEGTLDNLLLFENISAGFSEKIDIFGEEHAYILLCNTERTNTAVSAYWNKTYRRTPIPPSSVAYMLTLPPDSDFTLPSGMQWSYIIAVALQRLYK